MKGTERGLGGDRERNGGTEEQEPKCFVREGVSGREVLIVNHRGTGRETERETETANVGKIGCERERQRER